MDEVVRPVIELSYDLTTGDCEATCRIAYCGLLDRHLMDEPLIDLTALEQFPQLQGLKEEFANLLKGYKYLDCDHKRLSQEYVIAQAALYANAEAAQSLLEVNIENSSLKTELAKEKASVAKLSSKLRDRDLRKSKAEVLLIQTEAKSRELMAANSAFTKKIAELEKTIRETEFRLTKEKEALDSYMKTAGQRDDQVKKLLLKMRAQEATLEELKDDISKRDGTINALNKRVKELNSEPKANPKLETELKDCKNRLQEKETELDILKTMLRNSHGRMKDDSSRFRKRSKPSLEPLSDFKLPQIRNSSNSQVQSKLAKTRFGDITTEEDFTKNRKQVVKKAFGSPEPKSLRGQYTEMSRDKTGRSKSPVSFAVQQRGVEDYEDFPEIDFEAEEKQADG